MNLAQLAVQHTLDRIEEIISVRGDNEQTAQEIGYLLIALTKDPEFRHDSVPPTFVLGTTSRKWEIASHKNGSRIWCFEIGGTAEVTGDHVHYHGGWEVVTMVTGKWTDRLFETPTDEPFSPGIKQVKFDRVIEVTPGHFMTQAPGVPHGFLAGEKRDAHGILLAYVGANRFGVQMNLDPGTGKASVARPIPVHGTMAGDE